MEQLAAELDYLPNATEIIEILAAPITDIIKHERHSEKRQWQASLFHSIVYLRSQATSGDRDAR
jgi:hypothetical protein